MVTLLLNKLGGTNLEDRGDKTHISEEESQTWEAMLRTAILQAENAVRTLQSNNVFTNGPNIVVDEFTDADGTQGTVNTGSSTAYYNSVDEYTLLQSDLETGDISISGSVEDSDDVTWTGSISDIGYISSVQIHIGNTGNDWIGTIEIKNSSLTTIATKSVTLSNNSNAITSFELSDYSTLLDNETYSVVLTKTTGTGKLQIYSSNGLYSGTLFTISGRASTGTYELIFQQYNFLTTGKTIIADTNTTSLDGNELGFAVSIPDSDIPTGTSIGIVVSDGTSSLSSQNIDSTSKGVVIGNSGLSSGTLKCTFTLNTTDTSLTPTIKDYAICILR